MIPFLGPGLLAVPCRPYFVRRQGTNITLRSLDIHFKRTIIVESPQTAVWGSEKVVVALWEAGAQSNTSWVNRSGTSYVIMRLSLS
jgi:hypothetical protein